MSALVPAIHAWPTNGDLIADVAKLYDFGESVLDATYGRGRFWIKYRPPALVTNDLDPDAEADNHYDFRRLPWPNQSFDTVVFDPPYKLSGTPALGDFDDRYGLSRPQRWQDRMEMIADGAWECARVAKNLLLVKCQDQVVAGKVRWQTLTVIEAVAPVMELVDRFDMLGGSRPQPGNRPQRHARGRGSTLLVFRRRRP